MKNIKERIFNWYLGLPPTPEERLSEKIRITGGFPPKQLQKYHGTAKVARWLVSDPKWLIPTAIALYAVFKN